MRLLTRLRLVNCEGLASRLRHPDACYAIQAPVGVAEDIAFFFTDPSAVGHDAHQPTGKVSTLYLVRQESQDCFVGRTLARADLALKLPRRRYRRLFATSMVLFAGLDLLAKFYEGDDDRRRIGHRFHTFVRDEMKLTVAEATALWSVRNTIMHSFGLWDTNANQRVAVASSCRAPRRVDFAPVQSGGQRWMLCIEHLYRAFCSALDTYRTDLDANEDALLSKFAKMFPTYGWMEIRP